MTVSKEPDILETGPRVLVGMRAEMSLIQDSTPSLWMRFMPRRHEVQGRKGGDLYSVTEVADSESPHNFKIDDFYMKWAAVQVESGFSIPEGMDSLTLPGGLYAVFHHSGPASGFKETFQYIFGIWFPESGYRPDNRPRFEILSESYRPDDPDAEEWVWIPIVKMAD